MTAPQPSYGPGQVPPQPQQPQQPQPPQPPQLRQAPQGRQPGAYPQPAQNPPPRVAPTPTPAQGPGRQVLALLVAVVLVVVMAGVMLATQVTWGELWWQWPRGWFNVPRLVVYGTVLAGIVAYALLGRLLARGAMYVVGLVIVTLGGLFAAYLWFIVSLMTGLGL